MGKKLENLIITIKPYTPEEIISILCGLIKHLSIMGIAAATAYIAGSLMDGNREALNASSVGLLAGAIIARAFFAFAESTLAHDVAFRVIRDFRLNIFHKISELAPAYTQRKKTGQLGQSLVSDVEVLELFLAHTFNGYIIAVIITVIVFLVYTQVSLLMGLLFVLCSVLMFFVPYSTHKKADEQGEDVREELAESNSKMIESIQGLREIVTLNSAERRRKEILDSTEKLYTAQKNYGRRKGRESMLMIIISGVFLAAVMLLGCTMVRNGEIPYSTYTMCIMVATVALGPVVEAASVAQELGLVLASADRIQTILSTEPAIKDTGSKETYERSMGVIFENVFFAYEEEQEDVLQGIDLQIKPGEMVAIVGQSGAGKSTCANLILRYWDPKQGRVLVGGTDLRDYRMDAVRSMISAVQQEPFLFHASIRENIRLGKIDATEEEIIAAAKVANADDFIRSLPQGYDTLAGEHGYCLSGGQRQRISIARAILRDAPVIIFDEAVSALDTENEKEIQETLKQLMKDKTVIMIAHRLSTILYADRVVMLKDGKVCCSGYHEELLRTNEEYKALLNHQMSE